MDILNFLNENNGAIQAILVFVLVIVTGWYAYQTHMTVKEMRRARRSDFLPIISVGIKMLSSDAVSVSLMNIGKGLAQDIRIFFPTMQQSRYVGVLPPFSGSNIDCRTTQVFVGFNLEELIRLNNRNKMLSVKYKDIFGAWVTTVALIIQDKQNSKKYKRIIIKIEGWTINF